MSGDKQDIRLIAVRITATLSTVSPENSYYPLEQTWNSESVIIEEFHINLSS